MPRLSTQTHASPLQTSSGIVSKWYSKVEIQRKIERKKERNGTLRMFKMCPKWCSVAQVEIVQQVSQWMWIRTYMYRYTVYCVFYINEVSRCQWINCRVSPPQRNARTQSKRTFLVVKRCQVTNVRWMYLYVMNANINATTGASLTSEAPASSLKRCIRSDSVFETVWDEKQKSAFWCTLKPIPGYRLPLHVPCHYDTPEKKRVIGCLAMIGWTGMHDLCVGACMGVCVCVHVCVCVCVCV